MKYVIEFARGVERGELVIPRTVTWDHVKTVLRSRLPVEDKIKILKNYYWDTYSRSREQTLRLKKVISYFMRLRSKEERIVAILGFLETLPAIPKTEIANEIKKLGMECWSVVVLLHPELA
jgi:adenylate kinase family enzyme